MTPPLLELYAKVPRIPGRKSPNEWPSQLDRWGTVNTKITHSTLAVTCVQLFNKSCPPGGRWGTTLPGSCSHACFLAMTSNQMIQLLKILKDCGRHDGKNQILGWLRMNSKHNTEYTYVNRHPESWNLTHSIHFEFLPAGPKGKVVDPPSAARPVGHPSRPWRTAPGPSWCNMRSSDSNLWIILLLAQDFFVWCQGRFQPKRNIVECRIGWFPWLFVTTSCSIHDHDPISENTWQKRTCRVLTRNEPTQSHLWKTNRVVAVAPWALPSDHSGACTGSVHHSPHRWCCNWYETGMWCWGVKWATCQKANLGKRVAFTTIIL